MGFLQSLKDAISPNTDAGLHYECTDCGETFDTARKRCPMCGSTETKEVDGFEMRPSE